MRFLVVVATESERPPPGPWEVLVCGVGKTAAAVATARRLAERRADGVVSFGIAGAYPRAVLDVGDVVVATETAVVDEGLETGERFLPFAKPGMRVPGAAWTPTDEALRERLLAGGARAFRVVAGRVATVSVCAGSARLAEERGAAGALAEGMEGAAIAHAAALAGVPFAEVRGISNLCGPRSGTPFDLAAGVRNAAEVLRALAR